MPFSRLGKLAQAIAHSRTAPSGEATDRGPVGSDVSLNEDVTIGDLALAWLTTSYGRENGGETINRCERILQLLAPSADGLSLWRPVVLTTDSVLALTAPGRAIYVTLGLLQMIGDDDAPLALALAHEIAHHELGHVAVEAPGRWREWLGESAGLPVLATARINRWLFSPQQEYAVDRDGLARCHRAGFNLTRCITLFDVLARWVDSGRELGVDFAGDWLGDSTPFRAWLRERISGYPTLAERRAAAEVERTLLESGHV
jgi:predicted Zn-dependent protease